MGFIHDEQRARSKFAEYVPQPGASVSKLWKMINLEPVVHGLTLKP
jgi:hypothetical protein